MAREAYAPTIKGELDVILTAIMDIRGEKKDKKVNEVLQAYLEQETEKLTALELANYVGTKKDGQERQWAFEVMGAKIRKEAAGCL